MAPSWLPAMRLTIVSPTQVSRRSGEQRIVGCVRAIGIRVEKRSATALRATCSPTLTAGAKTRSSRIDMRPHSFVAQVLNDFLARPQEPHHTPGHGGE